MPSTASTDGGQSPPSSGRRSRPSTTSPLSNKNHYNVRKLIKNPRFNIEKIHNRDKITSEDNRVFEDNLVPIIKNENNPKKNENIKHKTILLPPKKKDNPKKRQPSEKKSLSDRRIP